MIGQPSLFTADEKTVPILDIFVPGAPVPEGSLRAFNIRGMRFPVVVHDNAKQLKAWRQRIAVIARTRASSCAGKGVAVTMTLRFRIDRIGGHFGSGRNAGILKPSAPPLPTSKKADLDKLVRSVGDALKGIAFEDDAQVVETISRKRYVAGAEEAGVEITVTLF